MNIVVATNNKGKLAEIKRILSEHTVFSQSEIGIQIEVEETGSTYEENAFLKADAIKPYTDFAVIADDSGLEVDVLDGAPGLYSARYAGDNTTPDDGIAKLLKNLSTYKAEEKTAHFVSCIVLILPNGDRHTFYGRCDGMIIDAKQGENGFGFDPIFFFPEYQKTFAQLDAEVKNQISHRNKALQQLKIFLANQ